MIDNRPNVISEAKDAFAKNFIQQALDMPWAAAYEIRRILSLPFIRLMFSIHGITWGKRWHIWGMPIIQRFRGSRIEIGEGILLRSWSSTNPLAPNHRVVLATRNANAIIKIGQDVGMTGITLVAAERIEIGDRVQIGANATIVDTDFHPLDLETRRKDFLAGKHAPVIIENDVFIGMNSLILKGVRVGEGSVIGAGSVVTINIPPRTIAAGNPVRVIKAI
jgi:acetyltransferase-like isoleucine patch superfamily enzyme